MAVALSWLTFATGAGAVQLEVAGLFEGKAIVVIDGGKPRTLSNGQSIGAVKLISATSESGTFEVDGKRRVLGVGSQSFGGNFGQGSRQTVVLQGSGSGHFFTEGSINGMPIRFLVDTGATLVSLGLSDARRIGLPYLKGERGMSSTANGPAPVYRVRLDAVKVGSITLRNVDALVHATTDMPFALLGMSFLSRMEMKHEGSQLTMTQRF